MAAGSDSTDVIMINGGDVAIDNTIIHNHSMTIFISMLHFCNDGLSGGQSCGCGRSIDRFCVAVGQIGENSTCPEYQFLHMYVDLNCCTGRLKKKTVRWGENSLCPAY